MSARVRCSHLLVHLVHARIFRLVNHVYVDFDDPVQRATCCFKNCREILQHLLGLRLDVLADEVADDISSDLACCVYYSVEHLGVVFVCQRVFDEAIKVSCLRTK